MSIKVWEVSEETLYKDKNNREQGKKVETSMLDSESDQWYNWKD